MTGLQIAATRESNGASEQRMRRKTKLAPTCKSLPRRSAPSAADLGALRVINQRRITPKYACRQNAPHTQYTITAGTGTWHSFAGVSQRMTFSQKRGMSSVSSCSSALQAVQAWSHVWQLVWHCVQA